MPATRSTPRAAVLAALPLAAARFKHRLTAVPDVSPYLHDPVGWIRDKLGEFTWSKQQEIANAVVTDRRVAVPSAHEVGKSYLAARLAAWWIDVHTPGEAFVVSTAPTARQVRAILWKEINRAHRKGKLAGRTNQTEWWLNEELVAFGQKPSDYDPSAFQGIHARYVLVIIDEGCGVPELIYVAAQSLAANENSRIFAPGNPDASNTHFAKICEPDSGWTVIPVDGLKSPNFTDEPIPDELRGLLMSPVYEEEMRRDYGVDHPFYIAKVRGMFPSDIADGVIPLSAVRNCQIEREHKESALLPVEIGFDVAAGGDDAVLYERRGVKAGRVERYRTEQSEILVGHAVRFIQETGATRIKVDVIGVGWAVAGRLEGLYDEGVHRAQVVRVNVGEASSDPQRFPKLRDELWWDYGRRLITEAVADLSDMDEKTIAQLIAPTWKPVGGRVQIEPKAETKKRLKRSPDDADAWLLAMYAGSPTENLVSAWKNTLDSQPRQTPEDIAWERHLAGRDRA